MVYFRIVLRSFSVRSPFILRSFSVRSPFVLRSFSVHPPLILRSFSVHPPFILRSSSVDPPFELRSISVRAPFDLRSGIEERTENDRRMNEGGTKDKGRCIDYTSVLKRRGSEIQKVNQQYGNLTKL